PFIFWGTILKFIQKLGFKILTMFAFASFFIILLMNFNGIKIWFSFLARQDVSEINRDIFIKQDEGKTLGQIRKAADFMVEKGRESGKMVCFYASADYERSYEYVFDVYFPNIRYDRISKSIKDKEGCVYFSMATAKDDAKRISSRYVDYFNFGEVHEFGRIAVWEIYPKESFINYDREKEEAKEEAQEEEELKEEVIEETELTEEEIEGLDVDELEEFLEEESDEDEEEENEAPRRKERVFWKNVFLDNYEE
ncbi:MAG: hypothetical protein PF549_03845, partial [Patescibacteria group bacterium]|nr:hypothetical protein [Patescibacteria group bacterium]